MLRVTLFRDNQQLFEGSATRVVLPGTEGELAMLSAHAPMLCVLAHGTVQIDETRVPIRRGIARVWRNIVTVMAR